MIILFIMSVEIGDLAQLIVTLRYFFFFEEQKPFERSLTLLQKWDERDILLVYFKKCIPLITFLVKSVAENKALLMNINIWNVLLKAFYKFGFFRCHM